MFYYVLFVIVVIILYLYVRFAYKVPPKVMILQTSLKDFKFDILLEKQPIVLQDRVEDIKPLWNDWFKYNMKSEFMITPEMEWLKNKYKYMFLHSLEDTEIILCNPNCKTLNNAPDISEQVIAIKLYKNMSLILPYRWYLTSNKLIHACGCHDIFSYFLPS